MVKPLRRKVQRAADTRALMALSALVATPLPPHAPEVCAPGELSKEPANPLPPLPAECTAVTYAIHKPRGVLSAARDANPRRRTLTDVMVAAGVKPLPGHVGRLDLETSGLILVTADGLLLEAALGARPRCSFPPPPPPLPPPRPLPPWRRRRRRRSPLAHAAAAPHEHRTPRPQAVVLASRRRPTRL